MPEASKSGNLKETAKRAVDAIMEAPDVDDDTKEEIFEELQDYIEDQMRILGEEDDEDDEDDNEIELDDED